MKSKKILLLIIPVLVGWITYFILANQPKAVVDTIDYKRFEKVMEIDFYEGGFSGPNEYLYIQKESGKILLRYVKTDGRGVDIKKDDVDVYSPDYLEGIEREIDQAQWQECLKKIAEARVNKWKRSYVDENILDGTQWHLKIEFSNGKHMDKSGSNKFPKNYGKVVSILLDLLKEP